MCVSVYVCVCCVHTFITMREEEYNTTLFHPLVLPTADELVNDALHTTKYINHTQYTHTHTR